MIKSILFGILCLFAFVTGSQARPIPDWPYERLFSQADLVVIAGVVTNKDTQDIFQLNPEHTGKGYIGIDTTFQVMHTLKGSSTTQEITLLHYRFDPRFGHADGMLEVIFRLSGRSFQGDIVREGFAPVKITFQEGTPQYLLFLKQKSDGRFEPVTGQYDAALSVREIQHPMNLGDDTYN